jgi:hypothetical protein
MPTVIECCRAGSRSLAAVPKSHSNEKTRDPPFDGGYGLGAQPRAQHRIERISPEGRRPMRTPEPDEGETTPADTTQERVRRKRLLIAAVAGASC